MAKLRTNHVRGASRRGSPASRGGGKGFGASLWRLFVLLAVLVGAIVYGLRRVELAPGSRLPAAAVDGVERHYLPTGPSDQVVHHSYYSLGYDEQREQARWVAYRLTPAELSAQSVSRTDDYRPDPLVRTGSAAREDFRNSGYSRGHLAPAGDMNFSGAAMSESFYYSNIAPQLRAHNGGVWRELEEACRDWVRAKGAAFIVSGTLVQPEPERIGPNRVAVPSAFYRVVLTEAGEGIGFVIPHAIQTKALLAFAKTIDEVEAVSGLDFFPELEHIATPEVEASVNLAAWPIDERRYRRRVNHWNRS